MPTWRAMMRGLLIPLLAVAVSVGIAVPPASAVTTIAQDSFGRTASNGFGRADAGGVWSISGATSRYAVANGTGQVSTSPNVTSAAYLSSVAARDVDAVATLTSSNLPLGGGDYEKLLVRRAGTTDYSGLLLISGSGAVTVGLLAGGTPLQTKAAGLTITAGTAMRIRVQAIGASPTVLRARAWRADVTEPTTWQVTASDSTAGLQSSGAVGIRSYRTSATTVAGRTDVDDLVVTDAAAMAENTPPTASFTAAPSARAVSVDATASSDQEGPIAGYAWSFGDGATASGVTASHAYAADGTFTITLVVTDGAGLTATTTRAVTVSSRPTQAQWLADVATAVVGATGVVDAGAGSTRPAIVLDIDNTAIQSYYQSRTATPPVLAIEQRAVAEGYTILVATGRSSDGGSTAAELANAGYAVTSLCFRDPSATSTQASKTACRAAWAAQGYTIIADLGNHTADLAGANSGQTYLLPNYGFLD